MAAVDPNERLVVYRFEAVFERDEISLSQLFKPGQLRLIHAVRTSADRQANDVRMLQCAFIERDELFEGGVRVCKRLEVDDEFPGSVTTPQIGYAALDLLSHGFEPADSLRPEAVVVTIGASPDGYRPVAVRTGKSCIDDDFVDPAPEHRLQERAVGVVARASTEGPGLPGVSQCRIHDPRL